MTSSPHPPHLCLLRISIRIRIRESYTYTPYIDENSCMPSPPAWFAVWQPQERNPTTAATPIRNRRPRDAPPLSPPSSSAPRTTTTVQPLTIHQYAPAVLCTVQENMPDCLPARLPVPLLTNVQLCSPFSPPSPVRSSPPECTPTPKSG